MLKWTDKLATGSATLDHQHQTLIDNVNHLEEMLLISHPTRADYEFILQMVDFLEFYAHAHFQVEEECMAAYRCPVHNKNKQAHTTFLQFFSEFKQHNQKKGFPREIVEQLHQVASQWIVEHIMRVDTQLRPCMKG